jgi:hypothetical protein
VKWRTALVVAVALVTGGFLYGHQFDVNPPGVLGDIWYGGALGWILVGLLAVVGFVVRRGWAFLVLLGPILAAIVLAVTGHQAPWEDSPAPGDGLWTFEMVFSIAALGVPVGIGVLSGIGWQRLRGTSDGSASGAPSEA